MCVAYVFSDSLPGEMYPLLYPLKKDTYEAHVCTLKPWGETIPLLGNRSFTLPCKWNPEHDPSLFSKHFCLIFRVGWKELSSTVHGPTVFGLRRHPLPRPPEKEILFKSTRPQEPFISISHGEEICVNQLLSNSVMGGTRLKFESWKVRIHTQNAS